MELIAPTAAIQVTALLSIRKAWSKLRTFSESLFFSEESLFCCCCFKIKSPPFWKTTCLEILHNKLMKIRQSIKCTRSKGVCQSLSMPFPLFLLSSGLCLVYSTGLNLANTKYIRDITSPSDVPRCLSCFANDNDDVCTQITIQRVVLHGSFERYLQEGQARRCGQEKWRSKKQLHRWWNE